jgi:hypothetical protein
VLLLLTRSIQHRSNQMIACACRKARPCHATRRYSLIMPPTRVSLRRRYCSRSTGSGSRFNGAACAVPKLAHSH